MIDSHYGALIMGYAAALVGWLLLARVLVGVWPSARMVSFERPWREVVIALLAAAGIIAIGQAYMRLGFLPETGRVGPALAAVNQVLIFSPVPLALLLRSHPPDSVWLGRPRWPIRLATGLLLAILAAGTYTLLRNGSNGIVSVAGRIARYDHVDEAVQVLLEDLTIAFLFVRLAAAIGSRWSVVAVALLFAVGHVPALIARGAEIGELTLLLRDVALGTGVILVLQRSRDILWFWPIHFALDMTQFREVVSGPLSP